MSREAFAHAVTFFVNTVSHISSEGWAAPALGGWSVRDLVGHTSRAMATVEQYATVGADREGFGPADDIAKRGRAAGQVVGREPAEAVRQIAARVTSLVESLPDGHSLATPAGKRSLAGYLPSRVVELTVHTLDLAEAIHVEVEPPGECLRVRLYSLTDAALRLGVAKDVAFALTGRRALADGFSLVP